jgi:hypothetical protein
LNLVDTNVYIVLAGKLYADPEVVKPNALSLAGRAVSSVLSAQARGDIQRMWTYSLLTGMNFHMTAIPVAYPDIGSGADFDPKIMGGLFEAGRRMHGGEGWRTTPPLTDLAQGEEPQLRNGRCLTFTPKGPQLIIKGPGKMRVPPMHPDAVPQPTNGGQPAMALPR